MSYDNPSKWQSARNSGGPQSAEGENVCVIIGTRVSNLMQLSHFSRMP